MQTIINILIIILVLVVSNRVTKVKKATDTDREMLIVLLKEKVKRDSNLLRDRIEEFKKELFNRNEPIKTNGKKTRTNSKAK